MIARSLATLGLLLTIIGCMLLYFFGLSPDIDRKGRSSLLLEQEDQEEIALAKHYLRRGRLGIALIGVGAVLQIAAVWLA